MLVHVSGTQLIESPPTGNLDEGWPVYDVSGRIWWGAIKRGDGVAPSVCGRGKVTRRRDNEVTRRRVTSDE